MTCVIHLGSKQGSGCSERRVRRQWQLYAAALAGAHALGGFGARIRVLGVLCACAELVQARKRLVWG